MAVFIRDVFLLCVMRRDFFPGCTSLGHLELTSGVDILQGGGKAGLQDRKGGSAGHAKYKCPICSTACPSLASMKIHWEAKHDKLPFEEEKCVDLHAVSGATTQGVAVRGSTKKK